MQDLNRAKEVLFNPETREEYRRVLEMQDTLSADNIKRLRKTFGERRFAERPGMPNLKPFAKGRFIIFLALVSVAVTIAVVKLAELSSRQQASSNPVDNIIRRNHPAQIFPDSTRTTIQLP